jgi:hypothetical protein
MGKQLKLRPPWPAGTVPAAKKSAKEPRRRVHCMSNANNAPHGEKAMKKVGAVSSQRLVGDTRRSK